MLNTTFLLLGSASGKTHLPGQVDVRDMGSISESGRYPAGGHGNPLQDSCLENPMDRGVWWATYCSQSPKESDTIEAAWLPQTPRFCDLDFITLFIQYNSFVNMNLILFVRFLRTVTLYLISFLYFIELIRTSKIILKMIEDIFFLVLLKLFFSLYLENFYYNVFKFPSLQNLQCLICHQSHPVLFSLLEFYLETLTHLPHLYLKI